MTALTDRLHLAFIPIRTHRHAQRLGQLALCLVLLLTSACTTSEAERARQKAAFRYMGRKHREESLQSARGVLPSAEKLSSGSIAKAGLAPYLPETAGRWNYFLEFNNHGRMLGQSKAECARAIADFQEHGDEIDRVVLLSLGWNNDHEKMADVYTAYIQKFRTSLGRTAAERHRTAVFCIIWDSDSNLSSPIKDLIPSESMADWLAMIPNAVMLPFTVWSKGSLGDRIGEGELLSYIKIVNQDGFAKRRGGRPPIYLVGHSFGCRILATLAERSSAYDAEPLSATTAPRGLRGGSHGRPPAQSYPVEERLNIAGCLLIMPAMSATDVPTQTDFPVIIAMSRHDHANSFLYPVANSAINLAYWKGARLISSKAGLPKSSKPFADAYSLAFSGVYGVANPFITLAYAKEATPNEQFGKKQNIADVIPNTLAHLPGVQIPVKEADKAWLKRGWGSRKGLLNLGPIHESTASVPGLPDKMVTPYFTKQHRDLSGHRQETVPPQNFLDYDHVVDTTQPAGAWLKDEQGQRQNAIHWIDCSDEMDRSAFIGRYSNRLLEYTLGTLDPIGSHIHYAAPYSKDQTQIPAAFKIMADMMSAPVK